MLHKQQQAAVYAAAFFDWHLRKCFMKTVKNPGPEGPDSLLSLPLLLVSWFFDAL